MIVLSLLLAVWTAAAPTPALKVPEFPEDLGAATIDVSNYPEEYQKTYKDILLHVYAYIKGGPARALNSPLIELDPQGAQVLRREHPELFAEAGLAEVSEDGWRIAVEEVHNRPPCCGACPVLTRQDAKALWRFFVYDSITRKTGANTATWIQTRKTLLEKFEKQYPKRYAELFPKMKTDHSGGVQ